MNPLERRSWKDAVLDHVLEACAAHAPLRDTLVFKGARILSLRLGDGLRQSLDIDSNLEMSFAMAHSRLEDQQKYLQREVDAGLRRFLGRQEPVRYTVERVHVVMKPAAGRHPLGWTGFKITVVVRDNTRSRVRGLPSVEIDVASPERLGANSTADLDVGDHVVRAYTLERLAGEKMRAS